MKKWTVRLADISYENHLEKILNELESKGYEIVQMNTFIERSGEAKTLVVGRLLVLANEMEEVTAENIRLSAADLEFPQPQPGQDKEEEKDLH